MADRPRAYYHDTRIELALEALKVLAKMCRQSGLDYYNLAGRCALAEREAHEWQELYNKTIATATEMSKQLDELRQEGGTEQEVRELKHALTEAEVELRAIRDQAIRESMKT